MSDVREAFEALENLRKWADDHPAGIEDGVKTWHSTVQAALQSQTAPAVPEKREWNQCCGRDDFKFTEGWNACRKAMLTAAPQPDHPGDADKEGE